MDGAAILDAISESGEEGRLLDVDSFRLLAFTAEEVGIDRFLPGIHNV